MGSRKTSSRPRKTNGRLSKRILRKTKHTSKKRSKKTKQKRYKYRGGSDDGGVVTAPPPAIETGLSVNDEANLTRITEILLSFFYLNASDAIIIPKIIPRHTHD